MGLVGSPFSAQGDWSRLLQQPEDPVAGIAFALELSEDGADDEASFPEQPQAVTDTKNRPLPCSPTSSFNAIHVLLFEDDPADM